MQVIKDADSFSAHTLGQYNILDSTCWTIHTLDDLTHDSVAISVWQHELYHFYQHMCTVAGVYRNHLLEQALTAVSDAVTKLAPQKQDALQVPLISYFDKEVTDSPRKTIRRYTVLIRRILSLLSGMCGCANLPTRVLTNQDTLALRYAQGKEPILLINNNEYTLDLNCVCEPMALAHQAFYQTKTFKKFCEMPEDERRKLSSALSQQARNRNLSHEYADALEVSLQRHGAIYTWPFRYLQITLPMLPLDLIGILVLIYGQLALNCPSAEKETIRYEHFRPHWLFVRLLANTQQHVAGLGQALEELRWIWQPFPWMVADRNIVGILDYFIQAAHLPSFLSSCDAARRTVQARSHSFKHGFMKEYFDAIADLLQDWGKPASSDSLFWDPGRHMMLRGLFPLLITPNGVYESKMTTAKHPFVANRSIILLYLAKVVFGHVYLPQIESWRCTNPDWGCALSYGFVMSPQREAVCEYFDTCYGTPHDKMRTLVGFKNTCKNDAFKEAAMCMVKNFSIGKKSLPMYFISLNNDSRRIERLARFWSRQ